MHTRGDARRRKSLPRTARSNPACLAAGGGVSVRGGGGGLPAALGADGGGPGVAGGGIGRAADLGGDHVSDTERGICR